MRDVMHLRGALLPHFPEQRRRVARLVQFGVRLDRGHVVGAPRRHVGAARVGGKLRASTRIGREKCMNVARNSVSLLRWHGFRFQRQIGQVLRFFSVPRILYTGFLLSTSFFQCSSNSLFRYCIPGLLLSTNWYYYHYGSEPYLGVVAVSASVEVTVPTAVVQ